MNLALGILCIWVGATCLWLGSRNTQVATPWAAYQEFIRAIGGPIRAGDSGG